MAGSGKTEKGDKKSARKPLPKLRKLSNTSSMDEESGGAAANDPASNICPTPTQPGYTQNTHLPFC